MSSFESSPIAQIILSEDQKPINTPGGSSISVTNPFLQLNVPFLRTTQNFSVTILINGLSSDTPKNFSLRILDQTMEEGNQLFMLQGDLPNVEDSMGGVNINIDLKNIILTNQGKHSAVLSLAEQEITSTNFYVVINE